MSTDVKALHDFLVASEKANLTTSLGKFSCEYLDVEETRLGEALLAIQGLAFRISQMINTIDLPEAERKDVYRYFHPFQSLLNYTTYSQTMQIVRRDFIKKEAVAKLVILDAIIAGKIGHVPELSNISDLGQDIDKIIECFRKSDLPSNLRQAILKRLLQIKSALKNYEIFGAQSIVDETANIIGVISLYSEMNPQSSVNKSEATSLFRQFSRKVVTGISKSRDLVEDLQFLADAGAEAAGIHIEDMSDKA